MKTKAQLKRMTKDELEEYGLEAFGVDIDKRRRKPELVAELLKLQGQGESSPRVPPGMARVTVTKSPESGGATVTVNGTPYVLPLNQPTTVPDFVVSSLRNVAGVQFTQE